jgi:hypothetical protein
MKATMMKTIIHTEKPGRFRQSFCSSAEQNGVPVSDKRKPVSEYDTYPALSRKEAARRRAHRLLDRKAEGEPKAVGQNADSRK